MEFSTERGAEPGRHALTVPSQRFLAQACRRTGASARATRLRKTAERWLARTQTVGKETDPYGQCRTGGLLLQGLAATTDSVDRNTRGSAPPRLVASITP